jgi:hypothetical protein
LQNLLKTFDLIHHVVDILKDESINLISITTTLDYIVDCHLLKLQWVYEGFCCTHVMFKVCQYVTNDNKIIIGLKNVSVKNAIENHTLLFLF